MMHAETVGDGITERRLPFGRPVTPDRISITLQGVINRLLKRGGWKAIDRRLTGGEREKDPSAHELPFP